MNIRMVDISKLLTSEYFKMFHSRIFQPRTSTCCFALRVSFRRSLSTEISRKPLQSGGHISHLSFKGPKKYPILSPDGLSHLTESIKSIDDEQDVRAIFLRSTIAGADINFMKDIDGPDAARSFIRLIDRLCSTIQNASIPVVSVIDGPCLGAGMEVAAACDLRIAARQGTVFGMPETKVVRPILFYYVQSKEFV